MLSLRLNDPNDDFSLNSIEIVINLDWRPDVWRRAETWVKTNSVLQMFVVSAAKPEFWGFKFDFHWFSKVLKLLHFLLFFFKFWYSRVRMQKEETNFPIQHQAELRNDLVFFFFFFFFFTFFFFFFFWRKLFPLIWKLNRVVSLVIVLKQLCHITSSFSLRGKVNRRICLFCE